MSKIVDVSCQAVGYEATDPSTATRPRCWRAYSTPVARHLQAFFLVFAFLYCYCTICMFFRVSVLRLRELNRRRRVARFKRRCACGRVFIRFALLRAFLPACSASNAAAALLPAAAVAVAVAVAAAAAVALPLPACCRCLPAAVAAVAAACLPAVALPAVALPPELLLHCCLPACLPPELPPELPPAVAAWTAAAASAASAAAAAAAAARRKGGGTGY